MYVCMYVCLVCIPFCGFIDLYQQPTHALYFLLQNCIYVLGAIPCCSTLRTPLFRFHLPYSATLAILLNSRFSFGKLVDTAFTPQRHPLRLTSPRIFGIHTHIQRTMNSNRFIDTSGCLLEVDITLFNRINSKSEFCCFPFSLLFSEIYNWSIEKLKCEFNKNMG